MEAPLLELNALGEIARREKRMLGSNGPQKPVSDMQWMDIVRDLQAVTLPQVQQGPLNKKLYPHCLIMGRGVCWHTSGVEFDESGIATDHGFRVSEIKSSCCEKVAVWRKNRIVDVDASLPQRG